MQGGDSNQRPPCVKGAVSRKADWGIVGTLRKYAGGIFLASDLGSYAAVASAVFTQRDRAKAPRPRGDETPQAPIITKIPSCHTGKSVVH